MDCFCVSCFSPASVVVFSMFYDLCLHWLSRYISVCAFLLKEKKNKQTRERSSFLISRNWKFVSSFSSSLKKKFFRTYKMFGV